MKTGETHEKFAVPIGAAVADAGRTVASWAVGRIVPGAVQCTLTVKGALAVVITFQRHLTFMNKSSVEFDLFANGLYNGSFIDICLSGNCQVFKVQDQMQHLGK